MWREEREATSGEKQQEEQEAGARSVPAAGIGRAWADSSNGAADGVPKQPLRAEGEPGPSAGLDHVGHPAAAAVDPNQHLQAAPG